MHTLFINSKYQVQQYYISCMWYLKKTAESVWNASKNLVDKRTPVQKLIDSISESQQQILPTNKLNELAGMTYELEQFDEIVEILFQKIKKFHYDVEESHKTLNLLIAINYLIKHGATGFVDVFRKYVGVFKKYEGLQSVQTYEDHLTQAKLDANLQKIKSRAHHIAQLLQDKQKLLKEKELSMLVKQKLKLYEKNKLSELNNQKYSNIQSRDANKLQVDSSGKNQQSKIKNLSKKAQALLSNPQELSVKLQGLLQAYVWKYVDKLDETIETASQKVMQQIDKYVLGQQDVHPFELQEDEEGQENGKDKKNKQKQIEEDDHDRELMKRLEQESKDAHEVQNVDLLEFEEVKPAKKEIKTQEQELI